MAIMQFHNFRRMHENGVSLAEIMASNILHFNTLQFQLQPVYVFPVSIYATFLLVTSTRHTVFINHVLFGDETLFVSAFNNCGRQPTPHKSKLLQTRTNQK